MGTNVCGRYIHNYINGQINTHNYEEVINKKGIIMYIFWAHCANPRHGNNKINLRIR